MLLGLYNVLAMKFRVRRLAGGGQNGRRYHLFGEDGRIALVADHGTPWLPAELDRHVYFARPDGDMMASMGLASHLSQSSSGRHYTSYGIIINHAVYAVINEYDEIAGEEDAQVTRFTIEVEGRRWLVLEQANGECHFWLYDAAPAGLTTFDQPMETPLPEPVGQIYPDTGEGDFTAGLPAGRLAHASLILLALIFLIDRAAGAK